jgi:hypothetical protein
MLGVVGVNIGTRFLASKEAPIDDDWQQAIIKAHSEDAVKAEVINDISHSMWSGRSSQRSPGFVNETPHDFTYAQNLSDSSDGLSRPNQRLSRSSLSDSFANFNPKAFAAAARLVPFAASFARHGSTTPSSISSLSSDISMIGPLKDLSRKKPGGRGLRKIPRHAERGDARGTQAD